MKISNLMVAVLLAVSTGSIAQNSNGSAYKASTAEKKLNIVNLYQMQDQVKSNMETGAFGYIRGGAEDENNMSANTRNFDKKYIMPRVMLGIEFNDLNITTSLFGIPLKTPIIQAPMAAQGLAHVDGEEATAKAMKAQGSIFSLSTYGNKTIEEVSKVTGDYPFFFQLYMSKNDEFNKFIINEAKVKGAKAIIVTVDSPVGGHREDDIENNFQFPLGFANLETFAARNNDGSKTGKGSGISEIYAQAKQAFTLADIKYVKDLSGLPVIVKGIQSPEDADRVIKAGADAIWVSNHGGRQLDSGPASIDVLAKVAKVVNKRVPVIFDSGVRRGSHIFKALASGADIVAIGRPILYGLNLGGSLGVESVIEHLNKELKINMMLGGAKNIKEVKATKLYTDKDFE